MRGEVAARVGVGEAKAQLLQVGRARDVLRTFTLSSKKDSCSIKHFWNAATSISTVINIWRNTFKNK